MACGYVTARPWITTDSGGSSPSIPTIFKLLKVSKNFEKIRNGQPSVTNISVDEQYRNKGIAKLLYKKIIDELRKDDWKRLFAGLTRNSMFINNIWNKIKDGEIEIEYNSDKQIIEYVNL